MKKLFFLLLAVMLLTACGQTKENDQEAAYMNITAEEAKRIMDTEQGYVILDTRTREEYDQGHIPGAIVIPHEEITEKAVHTPYIRPLSQPKFRQESHGLTPAERGTATHLVLQYLDFSNRNVAGQIEELRKKTLLSAEQAAAVDIRALERFLDSPLAEEIRNSSNVCREYRFTILMDAREYDPSVSGEDQILLQGVVDCFFETADGITVVDFKTDRVCGTEDVQQRAEQYRPQLEAYSRALEQVLEKMVVRKVLFFLCGGETVEL